MNNGSTHLKAHLSQNLRGRIMFLALPVACAALALAVGSLMGGALLGAALGCLALAVSGGVSAWTMLDDDAVCAMERAYELALPVGLAAAIAGHLAGFEPLPYAIGAVALSGLGFLAGVGPAATHVMTERSTPPAAVAAMRGAAALQLILTAALVAFAEPIFAAGIGGLLFSLCAALYAFRDHVVAAHVATH
jgi:hypothetical protein